jgi:hypothetical protein
MGSPPAEEDRNHIPLQQSEHKVASPHGQEGAATIEWVDARWEQIDEDKHEGIGE